MLWLCHWGSYRGEKPFKMRRQAAFVRLIHPGHRVDPKICRKHWMQLSFFANFLVAESERMLLGRPGPVWGRHRLQIGTAKDEADGPPRIRRVNALWRLLRMRYSSPRLISRFCESYRLASRILCQEFLTVRWCLNWQLLAIPTINQCCVYNMAMFGITINHHHQCSKSSLCDHHHYHWTSLWLTITNDHNHDYKWTWVMNMVLKSRFM